MHITLSLLLSSHLSTHAHITHPRHGLQQHAPTALPPHHPVTRSSTVCTPTPPHPCLSSHLLWSSISSPSLPPPFQPSLALPNTAPPPPPPPPPPSISSHVPALAGSTLCTDNGMDHRREAAGSGHWPQFRHPTNPSRLKVPQQPRAPVGHRTIVDGTRRHTSADAIADQLCL